MEYIMNEWEQQTVEMMGLLLALGPESREEWERQGMNYFRGNPEGEEWVQLVMKAVDEYEKWKAA